MVEEGVSYWTHEFLRQQMFLNWFMAAIVAVVVAVGVVLGVLTFIRWWREG